MGWPPGNIYLGVPVTRPEIIETLRGVTSQAEFNRICGLAGIPPMGLMSPEQIENLIAAAYQYPSLPPITAYLHYLSGQKPVIPDVIRLEARPCSGCGGGRVR